MSHLAGESGGLHVNLLRMNPEAACKEIGAIGKSVRIEDTAGCRSLHLEARNGRLSILGRLDTESGTIGLAGSGAPAGSLEVNGGQASAGRLIARAWAGREAQKTALLEGESSKKLLELGRAFGLVTPGTSLLVLESIDQYLEYDIEPPASLPAMVEDYRARKELAAREGEEKREKQLEYVLGLWQRRIAWWERDFAGEFESEKKKRVLERRSYAPCEEAGPAMPPPPAPFAMAPSPAPGAMDDRECDCAMSSLEEPCPEAECGAPCPDDEAPCKELRQAPVGAAIAIKPWSPDVPYMAAIRDAAPGQAYAAYLAQRREYAKSPSFYFDAGDYFLSRQERQLGLRILSNLVELGLDDAPLMRMYAWRLQQAGELNLAISILERVMEQRPDEPQSCRDLGLALGERWQRTGDSGDMTRAMELLYEVVLRQWDRFPEIETIALMELNRLIHLASREEVPIPEAIDKRLVRHLDLDIRISMSWDADLTDVDLHVFEPSGEHAFYGFNQTAIGGLVSRDFRDGYGPEEYVLRKALPGVYTIKTHYYGSTQLSTCGPCTVTATVFTNYGRDREREQVLMLRLDRPSDQVLVGEITIDASTLQ